MSVIMLGAVMVSVMALPQYNWRKFLSLYFQGDQKI
jgi:hypothetical protein